MSSTPNFDRVARIYRWAEYLTLGPLLQRTRTYFLPQLTDRRRAMVLGDGDGRFLAALLAQNPELRASALDSSAQMLALLAKRCNETSPSARHRLSTVHHNALDHTCSRDTDLIVSHFFLDCFTQPEVDTVVLHFARQVRPGTLWLLSDFRIPAGRLRYIARLYIRSLYFVFRILTGLRVTRLPDPARALTAAGFERIAQHEKIAGLLYTELWRRL